MNELKNVTSKVALWSTAMIDPYRVVTAPESLDCIVVAVDPAVTNKEKSDETGIVVAGRKLIAGVMQYYVLADRSLKAIPATRAVAAVTAYKEFSANRIVAEANGTDSIVPMALNDFNNHIPMKFVYASYGKFLRATQVAVLYEKGLVHHVGRFDFLEDQMRNYCGHNKDVNLDRVDALVWAISELTDTP